MHKYEIIIVMPDGSSAKGWGLFASDWDAINQYMGAFPDAKRISPRRVS